MLDLAGLKKRPDLLGSVDWQADPQSIFQAYQIKSIDSWKQRDLGDTLLFVVAFWPPQPAEVQLIRKTYTDSEELARLAVPGDLVAACLKPQAGDPPVGGLYAIDGAIGRWLEQALYGN